MRDSREMIKEIKNMVEEYDYIESLIADRENLFLAIRNEYLSIYYLGGCLAKIEFDNKRQLWFKVHEKYVGIKNDSKKSEYISLPWKEHKEKLELIKENIKKIALNEGKERVVEDNNSQVDKRGKITREKICQQWIINQNNNSSSDWYYIDMEYTMEKNRLGRFDMIAIKRTPENGTYPVALIELKVGSKSYPSVSSKLIKNYKNQYAYIRKNSLYEYQTRENYVSFGSGLVGHLCDYMRYLNAKYFEVLRKEIVYQIASLKELGILSNDDELAKIINSTQLCVKPKIYFVSFSHVVNIPDETVTSLEQMKLSYYKYMYDTPKEIDGEVCAKIKCSEYAAEKLLNPKEIEGLLQIRSQFLKLDRPVFSLKIGEDNYDFQCVFVDASKENAWDFLYE